MKRKSFLLLSIVIAISLVLSSCSAGAGSGQTKVRVATEAAYPPFEMVDEKTKELTGFDIELMKAIGEKAGFQVEFPEYAVRLSPGWHGHLPV